jgi:diacylglycerol kinase (ATP)
MSKPGNTGITRIIKATSYSWAGFKAAFKHEAAFRQELLLCLVLMPLGIWLGQTGVERALLIGSLLLVLVVELLNSALEAVVDRFGGEQHALSGRAKDIGSAAVFIALLNVIVVWGLVLVPTSVTLSF